MFFLGPLRIGNASPEAAYDAGHRLFNEKKGSAFPYLKYAAEQGHAKAQYGLGSCYKNGLGCREDLRKALYWYEKAAQQNYYRAQYEIAEIYGHGKGVPVNEKKALYWYECAAESGTSKDWCYSVVLFVCSLYYEKGRGCEVNLDKALYWQQKLLKICIEDIKKSLDRKNERSIELNISSLVECCETIHRLRSQMGGAADAEELNIALSYLDMQRELLEENIINHIEKRDYRYIEVPTENLVRNLDTIHQLRVKLGHDPKKRAESGALQKLFNALMKEFHETATKNDISVQTRDAYQKWHTIYKKIHLYIHPNCGKMFGDGAVS